MANWSNWESNGDPWVSNGDPWGGDASASNWNQPEVAPAMATDIAKKIKQLREGQWTDGWKDFLYWDDATNTWRGSEFDASLGSKGWWKFLYHDGQTWQPQDLAEHLEKQTGSSAPAAAAQSQWGTPEESWAATGAEASAQATEQSTDNWGNWNTASAADTTQRDPNQRDPKAKAFWEEQDWNVANGILSKKEDWELEADDRELFQEHLRSNAGIDFSLYDTVPVNVSGSNSQNIPAFNTFEEIFKAFPTSIPEACLQNVRRCKYQVPTPVQKFAIPLGLAGRDVMCCAQTGSGKTAAFLIPLTGLMMKNKEELQVTPIGAMQTPFKGMCKPDTLIMTPTRELCIQIHEEAKKFCHRTGYRCCLVYGGAETKGQLKDISKGCDLMVATPGRLSDFIERGVIGVSETYVLVLDEADRMLDMGFESQIKEIVLERGMPSKEERQTMMFSATFPEECQKMAQSFMFEYIWIGVGIVGGAVTTVTQRLVKVHPQKKYDKLIEVLDEWYLNNRKSNERCLVFVNAKDTAKWLDEQLYESSMDTGALHGNLTQHEREHNLRRYRTGDIDVMIATDVAARGLDIENVDLVLNYDLPKEIDTYVHRIGRSGRIGNRGNALSFIATDENGKAYEDEGVMQKLLNIMRDAKADVPTWLEEEVQSKDTWAAHGAQSKDSWGDWDSKDMRGGWQ